MPSADRVPTNNSHSRMPWHMWVVLIAGSTGSALRAVRPPNLHITPVVRRDLVYRASATGFLYRSPLAIMAQAICAILLASAIAATLVGRRANNAVSQGLCPVPWILGPTAVLRFCCRVPAWRDLSKSELRTLTLRRCVLGTWWPIERRLQCFRLNERRERGNERRYEAYPPVRAAITREAASRPTSGRDRSTLRN